MTKNPSVFFSFFYCLEIFIEEGHPKSFGIVMERGARGGGVGWVGGWGGGGRGEFLHQSVICVYHRYFQTTLFLKGSPQKIW